MTNDQNEDAATRIGAKCEKIADAVLTEMLKRVNDPEVAKSSTTAELRRIAAFGFRHTTARGDLAARIAEAAATELRRRGTSGPANRRVTKSADPSALPATSRLGKQEGKVML